jgi:hypothetical protein
MRFCIATIVGSLLVPVVALAKAPLQAEPFGYDPRPDFIAFNPEYREQKRVADAAYDRLKELLVEQQKNGRKAHCSRQVLQEAKWYTHSTADFERATLINCSLVQHAFS